MRNVLINIVTWLSLILVIVGIGGYAVIVFCGHFTNWQLAKTLVNSWEDHVYEIPISAVVAFAIVTLLRVSSFVPVKFDKFTLKISSVEVSGPTIPILLWVVVYVAIVWSIGFLKNRP